VYGIPQRAIDYSSAYKKSFKEKKSVSPEKLELAKAYVRIKKLEKLARSAEDIEVLKKFERLLKENP
jgi:hypothetical protein